MISLGMVLLVIAATGCVISFVAMLGCDEYSARIYSLICLIIFCLVAYYFIWSINTIKELQKVPESRPTQVEAK